MGSHTRVKFLRISSLNVNGIKSSMQEVNQLCERSDIIFLQELLILPFDCDILNQINSDFYGFALSHVSVEEGVVQGRPIGGVGVMWRKSLSHLVQLTELPGVNFAVGLKWRGGGENVLLIGPYLTTDYGSLDCLAKYVDQLTMLGLPLEDVGMKCILLGDFNARFRPPSNSRFFQELSTFCEDHDLVIYDTVTLSQDTFTFLSAPHSTTSWLDHITASSSLIPFLINCEVLYDVCVSDHMPMVLNLCLPYEEALPSAPAVAPPPKPVWHKADEYQKLRLKQEVTDGLELWKDTVLGMPTSEIYTLIIDSLALAQSHWIPDSSFKKRFKPIYGWKHYVKNAHRDAKCAFRTWRNRGKPTCGPELELMKQTRSRFKSSLRHCRTKASKAQDSCLSDSLLKHGISSFWQLVKKNCPPNPLASCVDGASGSQNIAELWASHYQKLLNQPPANPNGTTYPTPHTEPRTSLMTGDILKILENLQSSTACGPDGICNELRRLVKEPLAPFLTILFNRFLAEGSLPGDFIASIIVPIPKNKFGDLSTVKNYRGIAISNALASVFEDILGALLEDFLMSSEAQFGFKSGLDTNLATFVVDSTIEHYRKHGSPVFAVFLDATNAFDLVNHEKLFGILRSRGVPQDLINLLRAWYSSQRPRVRWGDATSSSFGISNGVRQGSKLSPKLFAVFIDNMIEAIRSSGLGCHVKGIPVNVVAYADDIVLLAPTRQGAQMLVDLCVALSKRLDIKFNLGKSKVMVFWSDLCRAGSPLQPIYLYPNEPLQYVTSFTYLGHILQDDLKHEEDVKRFRRSFFKSLNVILRRYNGVSLDAKITLFKAMCYHFYGGELWCRLSCHDRKAIEVTVNRAIKRLHGVSPFARNSLTCFDLGILTAEREMASRQLCFHRRVLLCSNTMVLAVRSVRGSFAHQVDTLIGKYGLRHLILRDTMAKDIRLFFNCEQHRYVWRVLNLEIP